MKKIYYAITLSFFFSSIVFGLDHINSESTNSSAEWQLLKKYESRSIYINMDRVERNNSSVYIWTLIDSKTKVESSDGGEFLSITFQNEIDCNSAPKRIRFIAFNTYSNNMAMGQLLGSSNEYQPWDYWQPGTVATELINRFCNV